MNQRQANREAAATLAATARELADQTGQLGLSTTDSERLRTAYEKLANELARRGHSPAEEVPRDHPTLDLQFDLRR